MGKDHNHAHDPLEQRKQRRDPMKRRRSANRRSVEGNKCTIAFGGGGGRATAYFAGLSQTLIDNFGAEAMCRFKFAGVSAGSFAAGYMVGASDGNLTPEEYYYTSVRKSFVNNSSIKLLGSISSFCHPLFTCSSTTRGLAAEYWNGLNVRGRDSLKNGRLRMFTTRICSFCPLPKLESLVLNKFETQDQFIDSIDATSYIPIYGMSPWTRAMRHRCIDGSALDFDLLSGEVGVQFVLFDRAVAPVKEALTINVSLWRKFDISDVWVWGDAAWADQIFKEGMVDAKKNLPHIQKAFQVLE